MNQYLCGLMLTVGLTLGGGAIAQAVAPVEISQNFDDVEWSKVINDPFDGAVVYDRNFDPGGDFLFVSRWSQQGIQATYRTTSAQIVGYRSHSPFRLGFGLGGYRSYRGFHGKRRVLGYSSFFPYGDWGPVYRRFTTERSPTAIKFAINGQVYTYEQGPVAPELATALASAPDQNMTIRLVWKEGGFSDVAIGRGTVQAWKTIFRPNTTPAI
ncbi:MAG: hypothetical protein NW220_17355 [Leptolyngbyaceae cyanobacterium bins.349]|nr:hypothetical protein [Leptolyngbyaceae cyanobacterium bins.349]